MTSGYPYSPNYNNNDNNRNPNSASSANSNSNNRSLWNRESFPSRGEELESLTLPPISRSNPDNRLGLPAISSSPLFVSDSHTALDLRSNAPAMTLGAVSASTTTATTTNSNSEPGQSRIKRPRSSSPPDLFSFDPFDEINRYRSPPPLPLSNSRPSSQPGRGSSFYDDDAEALENFDWDSFLSQDNENDEEIDDPFASPPRISNQASDSYGIVDLTDSSPAMVPPPEIRRALSGPNLRPATSARPNSPKRRKPSAGISKSASAKRRKLSPSATQPEEDVEVVDLAENSNLEEYEAAKAKRQEDLIKQQNQDEATKPVKLVEFQCIICMDNPTDLTVTHCGHLFCSECLHSALHAGNNGRKSCPVCRTSISTTNLPGRKPPKNGTFPIAIKLMTANKMGKKPKRN
ncbi:hypothetical protein BCIN_08g06210 [Botrytis cinerea B05.10]|uniref:RING-type domain-containing protein n=1 Tax=Botryotinia fuckeliana (strain B05.10) TaxID=332648 RepID=A0A384JRI9_BOTFB|nr:hypothetical protein BCIN_08g06210 [Botrytis cinerea B05.10]ATZ53007.1 hypothetical protein BCIN_08g06210 [Botrytis cinerea B05.10]